MLYWLSALGRLAECAPDWNVHASCRMSQVDSRVQRDYVIGTERVWLGRVAVLGGKTYRPRAVGSRHASTYLHLGARHRGSAHAQRPRVLLVAVCSSGREAL